MNTHICYAQTRDGRELPVIDITNPRFRLELTDAEQKAQVAKFLAKDDRLARLPRFLRATLIRLALRGSFLGKGIQESRGTYLGAIETYLFKLGPENMGPWAKPIDRRIAASLPALAVRLRLQDMARLMADSLLPALRASADCPLHFLDLAGGTAIDTLNALILLRKAAAGLLQRPISIDVLDRESAGPEFGERALGALQAENCPLDGLAITFRHVPWSWTSGHEPLTAVLAASRAANAIAIASSEGGLFEYGADAEIVEVLTRLRRGQLVAVVGSVTRADEPNRRLHRDGGAATQPRGLECFRQVIAPTGWTVTRAIERPFSDHVVLSPSVS